MTEVVAALIWDKDKFMICQRPAHKARALLWEFVGGKVEPGETKEQALIRECQEELAITLFVGDVLWMFSMNIQTSLSILLCSMPQCLKGLRRNWSIMTFNGSLQPRF